MAESNVDIPEGWEAVRARPLAYDESQRGADERRMILKDWDLCQSYQSAIGLPEMARKCWDYYEDNQIPYMPEGIPHVQMNIVKSIVDNKTASILDSPISIYYSSDEAGMTSGQMTAFSEYVTKLIHYDQKQRTCLRDAFVTGTGVKYWFWDETERGQDAFAKGGVNCEILPVLSVGFSNPFEKDVQKQEWVMLVTRESVARVKDNMCDGYSPDDVIPDDGQTGSFASVADDDKLATVYTRIFRIDGEVHYEKCTATTMICDPKPFNPYLGARKKASSADADPEGPHSTDSRMERSAEVRAGEKFGLYPISLMVVDRRHTDIYGRSDVEGMISVQNMVNLTVSLAGSTAIFMQPKYIAKEGALRGQVVTNQPGQMLTDYSKGTGDSGFRQMTGQGQISPSELQFPEMMIGELKKMKGSPDVMQGETSQDYSGNAIALLQAQAEKPIANNTKCVYESCEDDGRILLLFYKFFYEKEPFTFDLDDSQRRDMAKSMNGVPEEAIPSRVPDMFTGRRYLGKRFSVSVDAGPGGKFSQMQQLNYVMQLMQMGKSYTPDELRMFINLTPSSTLKDKKTMLSYIDSMAQGQYAQMEKQISDLNQACKIYKEGADQLLTQVRYHLNYEAELERQYGNAMKAKEDALKAMAAKSEIAVKGGAAPHQQAQAVSQPEEATQDSGAIPVMGQEEPTGPEKTAQSARMKAVGTAS